MTFTHPFRSFLWLVLFAGASTAASTAARAEVQITSQDGRLSINADKVSATELAEELSNVMGITVVMVDGENETLDLDIVDEPLEQALGKLSPNNMLVRDRENNEITEVVLMFGDGSASGGSSEQFLPSGSPADEVVDVQNGQTQPQPVDPSQLRDPSRAQRVREAAAAASSDANLPAAQVPPMFAEDGQLPPGPIDPETGLPLEPQ